MNAKWGETLGSVDGDGKCLVLSQRDAVAITIP